MKKVLSQLFLVLILCASVCLYAEVKIVSDSVNILQRGSVTEFIGNVRIDSEEFILTAQKATSDRETLIIRAKGSVVINYSSDTWRIKGFSDEITVDETAKKIFLEGNAKTIYTIIDTYSLQIATTTAYADTVLIDYSQNQTATLEGNVKILRDNLTVFSQKAVYQKNYDKFKFSGSPKALTVSDNITTQYSGDIIEIFMREERVSIIGDAHTRVYDNERK